jgi:hypothetical protein
VSAELISRINRYFGNQAVRRLKFVQDLTTRSMARAVARPNPLAEEAASRAVADLPEGPLKAALASLGEAVFNAPGTRRVPNVHIKP